MKKLLIEGWRGINHSFALINQYQLLCLATTPELIVYHKDAPFFKADWQGTNCGFDAEDMATINAFGLPPDNGAVDIVFRMSFPFRFYGGAANRIFVFGTAEVGGIPKDFIYSGPEVAHPHANREFELITPSNWSKEGLMLAGFGNDKVHVVPHGVDPDRFWYAREHEKKELRKHFNLPQHAFIFLNIGAMTWNKGVIELLRAFAIHKKSHPDSYLLLKGADYLFGNFFDRAVREALRLNPSDVPGALESVLYSKENLSNDELASLYRASDAYVSPYLAEAFNLPVLEAIASGLPVIITGGGPTDDFCRDEFALKIASEIFHSSKGRYLKPDIESLAQLMSKVVDDNGFRKTASEAGPKWARENFAWQAVTKKLTAVLTS
jgi:glycosyltransferase involved in cell wall biosynthesis